MLWLVQDFETAIRSELDCEHEARNCEIAARYAVSLLFWQKKKILALLVQKYLRLGGARLRARSAQLRDCCAVRKLLAFTNT